MPNAPIAPGRLALGIVLCAAGGISALVVLVLGLTSTFSSMVRVDAPGARELHLDPGPYTVYWESPAMSREGATPPLLQIRVEPKDGGPAVELHGPGVCVTHYSTLDSAGTSIQEFTIGRAGDYTMTVAAPQKKPQVPGRVAFSPSLGIAGVLRIVLVPFALIAAGVGPGLLVILKQPKPPAPPA